MIWMDLRLWKSSKVSSIMWHCCWSCSFFGRWSFGWRATQTLPFCCTLRLRQRDLFCTFFVTLNDGFFHFSDPVKPMPCFFFPCPFLGRASWVAVFGVEVAGAQNSGKPKVFWNDLGMHLGDWDWILLTSRWSFGKTGGSIFEISCCIEKGIEMNHVKLVAARWNVEQFGSRKDSWRLDQSGREVVELKWCDLRIFGILYSTGGYFLNTLLEDLEFQGKKR